MNTLCRIVKMSLKANNDKAFALYGRDREAIFA